MDDIFVDNILKKTTKKKSVQSGKKGSRVERELCKDLNKRFEDLLRDNLDWGKFSRTVVSGARWSQVSGMSTNSKDFYSGDVVTPPNFRWVCESKGGYNVDLLNASQKELDDFLKQVSKDSEFCKRKPMLFYKKDYKPRWVFVHEKEIDFKSFNSVYLYKEWAGVLWDEIKLLPDEFFFELKQD